jgi:hypothetical protein
MERLRQRRLKTASVPEARRSPVWFRDPGNVEDQAAAQGQGQGWEKSWAGGRGVPGEGGGWGDRMPGSFLQTVPSRAKGLRAGALAPSLPSPHPLPPPPPAGPSAPRSPSPPSPAPSRPPPAPRSRRRPGSPPAGTPPHCSPRRRPLPQPRAPRLRSPPGEPPALDQGRAALEHGPPERRRARTQGRELRRVGSGSPAFLGF